MSRRLPRWSAKAGSGFRSTKRSFCANEVGSSELTGEAGYSVLERVWARPTMEVHGIAGGFTGAGSKTVIPSKAVAKVSFRLVPNQDPEKILKSFGDFLQFNAPAGHSNRSCVF